MRRIRRPTVVGNIVIQDSSGYGIYFDTGYSLADAAKALEEAEAVHNDAEAAAIRADIVDYVETFLKPVASESAPP